MTERNQVLRTYCFSQQTRQGRDKVVYDTLEDAWRSQLRVTKRYSKKSFVYQCPGNGHWHLTTAAAEARGTLQVWNPMNLFGKRLLAETA